MNNIILILSILFISSSFNIEKDKSTNTLQTKIKAYELTSATLAAGKLMRVDSFPSKNITPRPIDVWLPENYSPKKKNMLYCTCMMDKTYLTLYQLGTNKSG